MVNHIAQQKDDTDFYKNVEVVSAIVFFQKIFFEELGESLATNLFPIPKLRCFFRWYKIPFLLELPNSVFVPLSIVFELNIF